ncbi:hypothetical protein M0805_000533 [Coniferiporia weirii]|nr:hypothetical protein M0805_000533 [Coniferiporia weirii]
MSSAEALPSLDGTFGCLFLAGMCVLLYELIATVLIYFLNGLALQLCKPSFYSQASARPTDPYVPSLWSSGTVQLYFYYDKYASNDKLWLKIYIFVTYVLDTTHQCFLLAALYSYFVTNYANLAHLNVLERPLVNTTITTACTDALVQALFVLRIWHLSKKNYVLTGILGAFILGQFSSTTTYFATVYKLPEVTMLATAIPVEVAMNSVATFVDTSIAVVIAYLLHSNRSQIKQTNSLISRLMAYAISTGLLTSVMSLMALVTALALPNKFIYLIPDFLIPKLYFNSILALYNSRESLRNNLIVSSQQGISMGNIVRPYTGGNGAFSPANAVSIKVDTERVLNVDSDGHKVSGPWRGSRLDSDDASYDV